MVHFDWIYRIFYNYTQCDKNVRIPTRGNVQLYIHTDNSMWCIYVSVNTGTLFMVD